MWRTGSKERITKEQMFTRIRERLRQGYKYKLYIGTDSMVHAKSKVVTVVALHEVGSGGIFFSKTIFVNRFKDLRTKIYTETQESLSIAEELSTILFEAELDYEIKIHSDIGRNGETKELINEITGWVTAMGYECSIKPNSWSASTIADKLSK